MTSLAPLSTTPQSGSATCTAVISRIARQNGTRGTDPGHANVMFVLGGSVRGGEVYGD
jgi:uncharacterized protein (DUF1501 family)